MFRRNLCLAAVLILIILISFSQLVFAQYITVTGVRLDYGNLILPRGGTEVLTATVFPQEASNKAIRWYTSDARIARVNSLASSGQYFSAEVKAIAPGSATITVETEEGNFRADCPIDVFVLPESVSVEPQSMTIPAGEKYQLNAVILPKDADNAFVLWESANPSIASVDQNGLVTGLRAGDVRIIARLGEAETINSYCAVTVSDTSIVDNDKQNSSEVVEMPAQQKSEPQEEPAVASGIDYNVIIIGALVLVIIIALIFIINSRRT